MFLEILQGIFSSAYLLYTNTAPAGLQLLETDEMLFLRVRRA